jgi:hypothetical protein
MPPRCPVRGDHIKARLGLVARRTARVWRSVPPAFVHRIEDTLKAPDDQRFFAPPSTCADDRRRGSG